MCSTRKSYVAQQCIFAAKVKIFFLLKLLRDRKIETKFAQKLKANFWATALHGSFPANNHDLRKLVFDWKSDQIESEIAPTTTSIITDFSTIEYPYKHKYKRLVHLVYTFPMRLRLCCLVAMHTGQKRSDYLFSAGIAFVYELLKNISCNGTHHNLAKSMIFNTEETALYFGPKAKSTVYPIVDRKISVRLLECSNRSLRTCESVSSDGTTLHLLLLSLGEPYDRVEKLHKYFPANVYRFCQQKDAWIWNI